MKRFILALFVALSVTAVSCEKEEEPVIPVFPETQQLTFQEDQNIQELSFTANTDWTLVSPVVWCKFIDEKGAESNSIFGQAGDCKVKVKVTEEGQLVGEEGLSDKTTLELIMKDKKQIVAEVIRSAKAFVFNLLDENGSPVAPESNIIELGYDEFIPFQVKANFSFLVTGKPDWVELDGGTLIGAVNQVVTGKVKIVKDGTVEKYPIEPSEKNVITFSDKEGKTAFNLQIRYAGMPEGEIEIESAGSRKDWNVSKDGITFTQEGANTDLQVGDIVIENELSATVKTLNDKFTLLFLEQYEQYGRKMIASNLDGDFEHPVDWMKTNIEKGKLTIMVDAAEADRTGYIIALPEGSKITEDNWFDELVINEMDPETSMMNQSINYEACEKYLVAELIQVEPKEEGGSEVSMKVTDNMGQELPLDVLTGEWVSSEYGVSEIYSYKVDPEAEFISLTMDPMLEGDYEVMAFKGATDLTDAIAYDFGLPNIWYEGKLEPGEKIEVIFKQNWMTVRVLFIELAE